MWLEEQERHRLADKLRQGPGQVLANVLMDLRALQNMKDWDADALRQALAAITEEVEAGYRALQEIVEEIHPPFIFRELGLVPWLHSLAQTYREQHGLTTHVDVTEPVPPLDPPVAGVLVRIVQEAMRNVRQHADATEATLRLYPQGDALVLEVEDNGRGLTAEHLAQLQTNVHPKATFGLQQMQRWAEAVGGRLSLHTRPAGGTLLRVQVPVEAEDRRDRHAE